MAVFSVQQNFYAFYNLSRLLAKCATASLKTKGNARIMHLCSFGNYMQNCSGLSKPLSDLELVSHVNIFLKIYVGSKSSGYRLY